MFNFLKKALSLKVKSKPKSRKSKPCCGGKRKCKGKCKCKTLKTKSSYKKTRRNKKNKRLMKGGKWGGIPVGGTQIGGGWSSFF